jgi:carboxylesterase
VAALLIVWLGGDFIYARIVLYRAARWESSVQRDPDGVQVGCRERTLGEGATALLLVHGFNDCPAQFDWLAPRLVERGYTCRLMRLPGFARPVEEYARTTRKEWQESLEREIAGLRASHDRVGIVAHSLGGAITIGHLLDHPRDADAAILLAPLVQVSPERSPLLPPRRWHAFGRFTLISTRVVETPFEVNATTPEARAYDRNTRFTPRAVFDEVYFLLGELDGRAAEFRTPLLMVLGHHDEVIDNAAAEWTRAARSCPKRSCVSFRPARRKRKMPTRRGARRHRGRSQSPLC